MHRLNIKFDILKFWNSLLNGKYYILIEKNQNNLHLIETPAYNPLEEKIPVKKIAKIVRQNYLQLETYLKEIIELEKHTNDSLLQTLKNLFITPLLEKDLYLDKADIANYIAIYLFLIGTNLIKTNHLYLSEKEIAHLIELTYQSSLYLSEEKIALIINILNFFNYDLNFSKFNTDETKIICSLKSSFFKQIPSSRDKEKRLALVYTLFLKSNQNLTTLFLAKLKTTIITLNQYNLDKKINIYPKIEKTINNLNSNFKEVSFFNEKSTLDLIKKFYYDPVNNDLQEILNVIFKTTKPKRIVNLKEYIDNHSTMYLINDLRFETQLDTDPIENRIITEIENTAKTFSKKDLKEIKTIIFTDQLDKIVNILKNKAVELNILYSLRSLFEISLTLDELIKPDNFLKNLSFKYSENNLRTRILNRKNSIDNFSSALKEIFYLYYEKRQIENEIKNLPDLNESIISKSISYFKKGIKNYLRILSADLWIINSNDNVPDLDIPIEVLSEKFNIFFYGLVNKNILPRILNPKSRIKNEDIVNYIVLHKDRNHINDEVRLFFLFQVVQKLQKKIKTLPLKHSSVLLSRLNAIKNAVQTYLNPWVYFCVFNETNELTYSNLSLSRPDLKSIIDVGFMLQTTNIISSKITNVVKFNPDHLFWYKELYNSLQSNIYKDKITSIFITDNRNLYAKILFDNIVKNLIE